MDTVLFSSLTKVWAAAISAPPAVSDIASPDILTQKIKKPVALVESEKTALIASCYLPEYT